MKQIKHLAVFAITALTLLGCKKETGILPEKEISVSEELATSANSSRNDEDRFGSGAGKHLYTLSNQVSGNAVLDYYRNANGTLIFNASYPTGGTGTGGGLDNQGAVLITEDEVEELLLAVNPGSNSISSFKIKENGLQLKSTVSSGGMRPVSITQHQNIVYVLNAGGTGNISGFKIGSNGKLTAIVNSTRPLSSSTSGAAQVSFVNEGKVVVITEKATNKIITYTINEWGLPGAMHAITSANPTPFGFDAGGKGNIFVSEAAGGAPGASNLSSYRVYNNGVITLIDGPVGAGQSAACWVVITGNGKYAFTTNTASNNISNYNVNRQNGNISVNTAIAATTGIGPIDAALSNNSKYLYILNAGSHTIGVYGVTNNGSLSSLQTVTGIPVGANGLAAR